MWGCRSGELGLNGAGCGCSQSDRSLRVMWFWELPNFCLCINSSLHASNTHWVRILKCVSQWCCACALVLAFVCSLPCYNLILKTIIQLLGDKWRYCGCCMLYACLIFARFLHKGSYEFCTLSHPMDTVMWGPTQDMPRKLPRKAPHNHLKVAKCSHFDQSTNMCNKNEYSNKLVSVTKYRKLKAHIWEFCQWYASSTSMSTDFCCRIHLDVVQLCVVHWYYLLDCLVGIQSGFVASLLKAEQLENSAGL